VEGAVVTDQTVMTRLKGETWDLHSQAESREFQKRLVRGEIERAEYAAWLGQMYRIHSVLDGFVRARLGADPAFAAVDADQLQSDRLRRDLEALGVEPAGVAPLPATRALEERIARSAVEDPLRLLGYHYVLEGSTNGNRFISRKLREVFAFDGERGFEYLDPYGDAQRERWASFKATMTGMSWSDEQVDRLVQAARGMFEAIGQLSLELQGQPTGAPA
jgi:heme oxygenase